MEKIKVAFSPDIFALQQYGGISRYFCSMVSCFNDSDSIDPRIIALIHRNEYLSAIDKKLYLGFKVPKIRRLTRLTSLVSQTAFPFIAGRFDPKIIHETYYRSRSYSIKYRSVITVYDMTHEILPHYFTDNTAEIKKNSVERADHIICISKKTQDDLVNILNVNIDKTSVIYLGYDKAPVKQNIVTRVTGKPYFLFVGSRSGYKNFASMMKAYASSEFLKRSVRIICFGGGEFRREELQLMHSLGLGEADFNYMSGDDDRLYRAYANAVAFIYPSLYEGFGIPLLEAMANGCPIIASRAGSLPEIAACAAELFDPNEPNELRAAMERMLQCGALRVNLMKSGHSRVLDFSWQNSAEKHALVYKAIA